MARLTHTDESGNAKMVDVGEKPATSRRAVAQGEVHFGAEAFQLLSENRLEKGDALGVARIAAIQAGKRTADWIPLCHQIPLDHLDVKIELQEPNKAVVTGIAEARWPTGVEMEALVAVTSACLTLYDMAKAVDRSIRISDVHLLEKSGGRSGTLKKQGESS